METITCLEDWTGYINLKQDVVYRNCQKILAKLIDLYGVKAHLQLIGYGYSGAHLCAALSMINQFNNSPLTLHYYVFKKLGESGSSMASKISAHVPTVILDDDICTGETLRKIRHALGYNGRPSSLVLTVIARQYPNYPDKSAEECILDTFPATKYWIR